MEINVSIFGYVNNAYEFVNIWVLAFSSLNIYWQNCWIVRSFFNFLRDCHAILVIVAAPFPFPHQLCTHTSFSFATSLLTLAIFCSCFFLPSFLFSFSSFLPPSLLPYSYFLPSIFLFFPFLSLSFIILMNVKYYLIMVLTCISLTISDLSIFSCAYWLSACLLWRKVHSSPLLIFNWFVCFAVELQEFLIF